MSQKTHNIMRICSAFAFCSWMVSSLASGQISDNPQVLAGYYLLLDNKPMGLVQNVIGGEATHQVLVEKANINQTQKKHLGLVNYEDITLSLDGSSFKNLFPWIKSTLKQKHDRKSGAIHVVDLNGHPTSSLNFFDALISEIEFPALDASSKDDAKLTLALTPLNTNQLAYDPNKPVLPPIQANQSDLFDLSASKFHFLIDGLESDCEGVTQVDAMTVKDGVASDDIGDLRTQDKVLGKPTPPTLHFVPNFSVTFSNGYPLLAAWYDDFVIKGNNSQTKERNATIEYYSRSRNTVLFSILLKHVGIYKLSKTPKKQFGYKLANNEIIASFYAEEIIIFDGPLPKQYVKIKNKSPARGIASDGK